MLCVKGSGQRQENPLGLANPYLLYSLETFFLPRCPEMEVSRRVRERGVMTLTTDVISKNRLGALGWFPVS